MPIDLNNINTSLKNNKEHLTLNPKWFDKTLTGRGGKTGLINEEFEVLSPANNIGDYLSIMLGGEKKKWQNGNHAYKRIPVNALFHHMATIHALKVPLSGSPILISDPAEKTKLEIVIEPISLLIHTDMIKDMNELLTAYTFRIYQSIDSAEPMYEDATSSIWSQDKNMVYWKDTINLKHDITKALDYTIAYPGKINLDALEDYLNSLTLYEMVCDAAKKWNKTIHEEARDLIDGIVAAVNAKQNNSIDSDIRNTLTRYFQCLEQYPIPLPLYKMMYDHLSQAQLPKIIVKDVVKANLNLLMNDVMHNLSQNMSSLQYVPMPGAPGKSIANYSIEQQAAIQSCAPLTLIQAGAGTGKTTTLAGRMEHMMHAGIDLEKALVLTFTNAAALNISEKQPLVRSSTIASMVHEIYQANFQHKLSNPDTLMNSLKIFYDLKTNPIAEELYMRLKDISKNDIKGFTLTNMFLENNLNAVIEILHTVDQTCLELEILIMYQMMDSFLEPDGLNPEHIIMDEVQDTSIFEFIFILNYTIRKNASLYLVGDSSQTLYEFRFSNPKAINILEASGIFETHALTTNYRSNQAILDFANIALADIEANQIAKIQLHANQFKMASAFEDKVAFFYHEQGKKRELPDQIRNEMGMRIKDWMEPLIAKGEQVAFLAYTRRAISTIEGCLQTMYPNKTINNLIPDKPYTNTLFSKYISKFWGETKFLPIQDFIGHLTQAINKHITDLCWNQHAAQKAAISMQKDMQKFAQEYGATMSLMEANTMAGRTTSLQFLDDVKNMLLNFEIKKNAAKFRLMQEENQNAKKDTSGDFVLSTIHSAKGLEFPNVCVIYTAGNNIEEDQKRMYYVAFTRATSSMLVAAFDTAKHSVIGANWQKLVDKLAQSSNYNVTASPIPVRQTSENEDDKKVALLTGMDVSEQKTGSNNEGAA